MAISLDDARAHVGGGVAYRARGEHRPWADPPENGVITSVSDRFVFVRYGDETASKATSPEDLTLLAWPARDIRQEEYERYAYGNPGIRL